MKRCLSTLAALLAVTLPLSAADPQAYSVTVTGAKNDRENAVVSARVRLPKDTARVRLTDPAGKAVEACQLVPAGGSAGEKEADFDLFFVVPKLAAGAPLAYTAEFSGDATPPTSGPRLVAESGGPRDRRTAFVAGDARRPVAQVIAPVFDDSNKDARFLTYKPFHHLFDPVAGKVRLTNGPVYEGDKLVAGELGKYPHHRGIYYGFNKVSYGPKGEKKADVWHCTGDAHQTFEGFGPQGSGPVLDRAVLNINWHGPGKEVFAREARSLAFFAPAGGTLVEFASELTPAVEGTVRLDGDPQHAGFHFRANALVETKTAKETYFLRPDGKGKPGETRNWEPKTKMGPVNLPWDAMSFVLEGKRYTVLYLNHPDNPGESRHSERDYGRIGCYFEYDLSKDRPLKVRYRLWVVEGELTGEQCAALHREFADPPKVTVAKK
jgi:hypothetical protein